MAAVNLLNFDLPGLTTFCRDLGEKPFRAVQIFRWIHQRGVDDFAHMSDLSKTVRAKLQTQATVCAPPVLATQEASDGCVKWLFDVGAGNAVETVFIPEDDRGTLCISSQVGCAVGCTFCATGHQGFSRNLTSGEIIAQLWFAQHILRTRLRHKNVRANERVISNVVMMGMGEPLQNYHQLLPALQTMLSDYAYGLSRRRVTVSTTGIVPMMERLGNDCPVALAVSLHAPTDALRDQLVPLNRKYPLQTVLQACQAYVRKAPRDFITLEYCMLKGVNDSPEHAKALLALLRTHSSLYVKLNLIPFNPFVGSSLESSSRTAVLAFAKVLQDAGIITTVRKKRGDDIAAACGQLAGTVQDRTQVKHRIPVQAISSCVPTY